MSYFPLPLAPFPPRHPNRLKGLATLYVMRAYLTDTIYHDLDESDYDIEPVEPDSMGPTVLHGRVLLKPEAMWRHKEDGSYDNRPNNPHQYFRDYYHANRAVKTECKICGASVAKQSLHRHMRTKGCRRVSQAVSLALAKATLNKRRALLGDRRSP